MKIEKVSDYQNNEYPTLDECVNSSDSLLKKGGSALLAVSLLASAMTLNSCKTKTVGDMVYSGTESSQSTTGVLTMGEVACPLSDTSNDPSFTESPYIESTTTSSKTTPLTLAGTRIVSTTTETRFAGMPLKPTEQTTTLSTDTSKTSTSLSESSIPSTSSTQTGATGSED